MTIRLLTADDIPRLLEIEQNCFEYPWTKCDFMLYFNHISINRVGIGYMADGVIVAYALYELHKNRIHINSICVHSDHRSRGIGKKLVSTLIRSLNFVNRNRIYAEIRETNLAAQLVFKSFGFRCIRILPNFYDDVVESAYLMEYRHTATEQEKLGISDSIITRFAE